MTSLADIIPRGLAGPALLAQAGLRRAAAAGRSLRRLQRRRLARRDVGVRRNDLGTALPGEPPVAPLQLRDVL